MHLLTAATASNSLEGIAGVIHDVSGLVTNVANVIMISALLAA